MQLTSHQCRYLYLSLKVGLMGPHHHLIQTHFGQPFHPGWLQNPLSHLSQPCLVQSYQLWTCNIKKSNCLLRTNFAYLTFSFAFIFNNLLKHTDHFFCWCDFVEMTHFWWTLNLHKIEDQFLVHLIKFDLNAYSAWHICYAVASTPKQLFPLKFNIGKRKKHTDLESMYNCYLCIVKSTK